MLEKMSYRRHQINAQDSVVLCGCAGAIKSSGGRISFGTEVQPEQNSVLRSPIGILGHNPDP